MDHFCYLCFVFVMLSCLLIAAVCSLSGKGLTSWLLFLIFKDKDYCPIEIIKGLTDKGQFHYLTKLKGPQVGDYLYTAQFLPLR